MEPNLLNRCLLNKTTYRKGFTRILRPRFCYLLIVALVMLGFAVYYTIRFLPQKDLLLTVLTAVMYGLAAAGAVLALTLPGRSAKLQIRRLKEQRQVTEYESLITFLPEEIIGQSSLSEDQLHLGYDSVKKLLPCKGLILLYTYSKMIYTLDPARFENGTEADFWRLMNEKCPKAVPRAKRTL